MRFLVNSRIAFDTTSGILSIKHRGEMIAVTVDDLDPAVTHVPGHRDVMTDVKGTHARDHTRLITLKRVVVLGLLQDAVEVVVAVPVWNASEVQRIVIQTPDAMFHTVVIGETTSTSRSKT